MRIGMILDKSFPPDPRVENEALLLLEQGHEVFLFCRGTKREVIEHQGIQVCRYTWSNLIYKLSALAYEFPFYHRSLARRIKDFIENQKLDILHVHDIRIAGAVDQANQLDNLPCVLDLHDNYPEIMQYYPHYNKFPGNWLIRPELWKRAEGKFIRKWHKTITVSPDFVDLLKKRFPEQEDSIICVPNSIRRSFYTQAVLNSEIINRTSAFFSLLYVGDTGLRRGLLSAIEAVKILVEDIPEIRLFIVGSNSSDQVLKDKVQELELSDYVIFEGWKDMSTFPSYMKGAKVGLSPLLRNIQHDVAYANKLFQYMGYSLPVVVSDCPAQEKLVKDHNLGLTHRAGDAQDMAAQIKHIYLHPEEAQVMGKNGFDFIDKEFCWEESSKSLVHLYKA